MRPQEEGIKWQTALRSLGAEVDCLPMIEILPLSLHPNTFISLIEADHIIITSQQAVKCASDELLKILKQKASSIITLGQSIAEALRLYEIEPAYIAPDGMQSEDFLTLEGLQAKHIAHQKVVLLVGKQGRKLIPNTLAERCAKVKRLEVYTQQPVAHALAPWFESWQSTERQMIFVVTSRNIFDQWLSLVPTGSLPWLVKQPLLVISRRLEAAAAEYGFQHIVNTHSTDLQEVVKALQGIVKICHTSCIL